VAASPRAKRFAFQKKKKKKEGSRSYCKHSTRAWGPCQACRCREEEEAAGGWIF
jgi:hypothetical protein